MTGVVLSVLHFQNLANQVAILRQSRRSTVTWLAIEMMRSKKSKREMTQSESDSRPLNLYEKTTTKLQINITKRTYG